MNLRKFSVLVFAVLLTVGACSPDDGNFTPAPERDRAEQQVIDNDSLLGYFQTHYYNSSTFDGSTDFTIEDVVITELPKDDDGNYLPLPDPDNNTLLSNAVETHTTSFLDVDYTYYILRLNQGSSVDDSPKFTDNIRVRYSGNLMDEDVFDSAVTPVDFDLVALIPAWNRVVTQFNPAESFEIIDGQVTYSNYGLGVMFVPSGLAYFGSPPFGVPVYSNLIFKFELLQTEENDHDNDGIPSYLEDFDGNGGPIGDMNVFNDDTDGDTNPNFTDSDDDGDGILTINEDINNDGDPTNDDTDGDGIPNYLDEDSTESNED